jgi:methylmalonyl-CoA/ethylmalonyl-CoA epimerase
LLNKDTFSRLDNIGVVVSDLDAAVAHFQSFGIGPFQNIPEEYLRAGGIAKTSRAMIGEVDLELMQPGPRDSIWRRFLDKGDGICHLGFGVGDLQAEVERCTQAGLAPLYKCEFEGGGLVGFDAREHGGAILELSKYPPGLLGSQSITGAPYAYIHHVGFVLKDLDAAVSYYQTLGFGPFGPLKLSGERIERTQYGKPTPYRLKNAGTHIGTSKVELEFLQPLESAPLQEDFLLRRGEGANHLGFKVSDVDSETAKLKEKGFDVVLTVAFTSGTKCKYLDTRRRGGLLVEFWQPPSIRV